MFFFKFQAREPSQQSPDEVLLDFDEYKASTLRAIEKYLHNAITGQQTVATPKLRETKDESDSESKKSSDSRGDEGVNNTTSSTPSTSQPPKNGSQ